MVLGAGAAGVWNKAPHAPTILIFESTKWIYNLGILQGEKRVPKVCCHQRVWGEQTALPRSWPDPQEEKKLAAGQEMGHQYLLEVAE